MTRADRRQSPEYVFAENEARIQALRVAVLTEAAAALQACALVLERAAEALTEEAS
jgi:hypothetical protein